MLKVTYEWKCDVCGETRVEEQDNLPLRSTVIQYFALPPEWRWIDGKFVCPKHEVTVEN